MTDSDFKYWGFLSYSQLDNGSQNSAAQAERGLCWGDWLYDSLKSFSIPVDFTGHVNARGEIVPSQISEIFQDRQEQPDSADLPPGVRGALEQSRCLIVICSPHSAKSRHVNEAVRYFKQLGRGNRILPLVIAGEPNVSDGQTPGAGADNECFVPAMRHPVRSDGTLDEKRREQGYVFADARHGEDKQEILAKDLRHAESELERAKLQLIAGLIGVGFNGLLRREQKRRFAGFAEAQQQAREAQDKFQEAQKQIQELQLQTQSALTQLETAQNQVREAQNKILEIQNLPQDVKHQILAAQNEARQAQDTARELQNQVQALQQQSREFQQELEAARNQLRDTQGQLEEARRRERDGQAQVEEACNQTRLAQNQLEAAQGKVLTAETLAREAQSQLDHARRQVSDAQQQVQTAQNSPQAVPGQIEAAHHQVLQAQTQVDEARQQTQQAQTKVEAAQAEARDAQSQILKLQSQAQLAQNQLDEARAQVRDAQTQVEAAHKQASLAQDQLAVARQQNLDVQAKIEAAQTETRAAQQQLQEFQSQARAAQDQVAQARNEARTAQSQIEAVQDKTLAARRLTKVFAVLAALAVFTAAWAMRNAWRQHQAAAEANAAAPVFAPRLPDTRQQDLEKIIATLAAGDRAAALVQLNHLNPAPDAQIYSLLFQRWAADDPLQALQQRQLLSDQDAGGGILSGIMSVWMRQQPADALNWLLTQPDSPARSSAVETCVWELSKADFPQALVLTDFLPEGNWRDDVVAEMFNHWNQTQDQ